MTNAATSRERPEAVERFDPATMSGLMIEADHMSRYHWAAQFAGGRRVLDAGCGTAFGTVVLSRAGAEATIGIDIAGDVLDAARKEMPPEVRLEVGDVRRLDFPDDSFDLVVCFETIEHVEEAERVLDEFRRVLTDDGLLIVSTPNRNVSVKGNPYHVHEFTPEELASTLGARFKRVVLYRQSTWVASGIFDDKRFATRRGEALGEVDVRKLPPNEPGTEPCSIALAGGDIPEVITSLLELNSPVEIAAWDDQWHQQREYIDQQSDLLERQNRDLYDLRSAVLAAENELSRLPDVETALTEAINLVERLQDIEVDRDMWRDRFETIASSKSWKLTRAFRRLAAAIRNP